MLLFQSLLRNDHLASLPVIALAIALTACGGGQSDEPAPFTSKTISGTVVTDRVAKSNAPVRITCSNGSDGVRSYYTTTDANGYYRKSVDAAFAPCTVTASSAYNNLFSFAANLNEAEVTANVSLLTDAMLVSMMGTRSLESTLTLASGLASLQDKIAQGKDAQAWAQLRKQLSSGSYFTDPADVAAMTGDPATNALRATTDGAQPGHYALLQKLYDAGYVSRVLMQVILIGQRYELVASSNGAEVADLNSGLVWMRCVAGMHWNGTTCTGTPKGYFWTEVSGLVSGTARSEASNASAWRMPTLLELSGLQSPKAAAIDPVWFPASPADWTWTGETPCRINGINYPARVINMQDYTSSCGEDADQLYVRLVR